MFEHMLQIDEFCEAYEEFIWLIFFKQTYIKIKKFQPVLLFLMCGLFIDMKFSLNWEVSESIKYFHKE